MSEIAAAIESIRATLPSDVCLVAVSKFHPAEAIAEAYAAGQRDFGESRVQELMTKVPVLPADIRWHFIGHLQTNKVRQLIGTPYLIHSIDSERLLQVLDRMSAERGISTRVLMQVHVAQEETKTGFLPDEILRFFARGVYRNLQAVDICGIMAMASNTDDMQRVKADFDAAAAVFRQAKELAADLPHFDTLSMGMSHDYRLAIDCGSNMVRVGSAIFGDRLYPV